MWLGAKSIQAGTYQPHMRNCRDEFEGPRNVWGHCISKLCKRTSEVREHRELAVFDDDVIFIILLYDRRLRCVGRRFYRFGFRMERNRALQRGVSVVRAVPLRAIQTGNAEIR